MIAGFAHGGKCLSTPRQFSDIFLKLKGSGLVVGVVYISLLFDSFDAADNGFQDESREVICTH